MTRLLLLTHDPILIRMFNETADDFAIDVVSESHVSASLERIRNEPFDALLAVTPLMTERCPRKILAAVSDANPYLPCYFIVNDLDVGTAISLTKLGAEYCFTRPFAVEGVLEHIGKTLAERDKPAKVQQTLRKPNYFRANGKASQELYSQIDMVADTNFKVIIYGETGTGKESVARRLCNGIYKDRPFVAVDCGCLSRDLAVSELFGHKKGSFSGAFEDKVGAFEAANNGTIFLDEIGNLDYSVQVLLLRAIEERKIKKVGSNTEIDINVRIIVASNERLLNAVEGGRFREDLYYRLNEFEIVIPPLRDRMEDLEPFIQFFIDESNQDLGKSVQGIHPDLLSKFLAYSWPGNLRELKNVIRRGCLAASRELTIDCLSEDFVEVLNAAIKSKDLLPVRQVPNDQGDLRYRSVVAEYEEILKVLKEEKYNKSRTAQRLNINRKTLYNKISNFNRLMGN